MKTLNIVLINICLRPYLDKSYFPIGLAYVATALEQAGYAFDIIDLDARRMTDEQLEAALRAKKYDMVAFGTLVSGYRYAKSIAAIARRANDDCWIVAGNSVASSIPEVLLQRTEVDIAVTGEGEVTLCRLVRALEQGDPLETVKGIVFLRDGAAVDTGHEAVMDIGDVGFPHWELFDVKHYIQKAMQDVPEPYAIPKQEIRAFYINTARGCPFRCTFCYHVFQYTNYRHRTAESIVCEVATLQERYGVNYINFFDELTFHNRQQVERFANAVLARPIRFYWIADIRSDLFTDGDMELLKQLKRTGCQGLGYSLESGSADILRAMGKRLTMEDFKRQKRVLDAAGIRTYTSLVIGYPQETLETLRQTFDVCYELNIYPSVGYLLPQPGTPMFEVAKQKGLARDIEQFLMGMGDRQDLRFNLTAIPDQTLIAEVNRHLKRISDKLGLGLSGANLIKTGTMQASQAAAIDERRRDGD